MSEDIEIEVSIDGISLTKINKNTTLTQLRSDIKLDSVYKFINPQNKPIIGEDKYLAESIKGESNIINTIKTENKTNDKDGKKNTIEDEKLQLGDDFKSHLPARKEASGSYDYSNSDYIPKNPISKVRTIYNLNNEEIISVLKHSNVLHGVNDHGDRCEFSLFKVCTEIDLACVNLASYSEIHVSIFESDEEYFEALKGHTGASLNVSVPILGGIGASIRKAKGSTSSTHDKTRKVMFSFTFPRCRINLEPSKNKWMDFTSEFLSDVNNVLEIQDTEEKRKKLLMIEKSYGPYFPKKVTLGGCLFASSDLQKSTNEEEVISELKAKAIAKVQASCVNLDFNLGGSNSNENRKDNSTRTESLHWSVAGGIAEYANDIPNWIPTIEDPNHWTVIKMEDYASIFDLLLPITADKIKEILKVDVVQQVPAVQQPVNSANDPSPVDVQVPAPVVHRGILDDIILAEAVVFGSIIHTVVNTLKK